jgi:hypothetical protein
VNMTLAISIAWLAVGLYIIVSGMRHRPYLQSLPPTRGNRSIQRQHSAFTLFGVAAVALGIWHLVGYFRQ